MRSGKKSWSRKPLECLDLVVHPHECKQSKRETRSDVSRILRRSRTYSKRSHYDAKVSHRDAKRSHPDTKVSHPDAKRDASFASLLDVNDDASARYRKRPTRQGVFSVAKPKKHPKTGFLSLHNSDLRRFWHVIYFGSELAIEWAVRRFHRDLDRNSRLRLLTLRCEVARFFDRAN